MLKLEFALTVYFMLIFFKYLLIYKFLVPPEKCSHYKGKKNIDSN